MEKAKNNMRGWVVFSIVAAVLACLILLGSYFLLKNVHDNKPRPTTAQITAKVIDQMGYQGFVQVEPAQLSNHYDIPDETISSFSLYIGKSSENGSELACFLLTSAQEYPKLQTAVSNHMKTKAAAFEKLNPAQYEALQKYVIHQNGDYVLVTVGNDSESDLKIFNQMLR